jgi:hypothetical protein
MSEYQYYEFQAIDRPLSGADRQALRKLSTRARITATSFTNSYEWGDFKGDPAKLMEDWFDLHLYLANWGSRRLMMRLPSRLVDARYLDGFLGAVDWVKVWVAGEHLILDIARDEEPDDAWDDGSGWLAALAPLRGDVICGDLRLFYLLWLMAVEGGDAGADDLEPMPGIGPMTGPLGAFADFFGLDPDLVSAAAERDADAGAIAPDAVRQAIASMSDHVKTEMLLRLHERDPHLAAELRAMVRGSVMSNASSPIAARSAADLRSRARELRLERERAEAARDAAERRRQAAEAEKAQQARLVAIEQRGEDVWRDVEAEIERRSAVGYERATALLHDLRALAEQGGILPDFTTRLRAIRERHSRKAQLIKRLAALG